MNEAAGCVARGGGSARTSAPDPAADVVGTNGRAERPVSTVLSSVRARAAGPNLAVFLVLAIGDTFLVGLPPGTNAEDATDLLAFARDRVAQEEGLEPHVQLHALPLRERLHALGALHTDTFRVRGIPAPSIVDLPRPLMTGTTGGTAATVVTFECGPLRPGVAVPCVVAPPACPLGRTMGAIGDAIGRQTPWHPGSADASREELLRADEIWLAQVAERCRRALAGRGWPSRVARAMVVHAPGYPPEPVQHGAERTP